MKSVLYCLACITLGLFLLNVSGCVSKAQYDDCVRRNQIQEENIQRLKTEAEQERLRSVRLQQQMDLIKETEPFWQQQISALEEQLAKKQQIIDQLSEQVGQIALPPELSGALADWALQSGADLVTYDEKTGIVRFKSDLLFNLGSDTVQDEALASLQGFAQIMNTSAANGFDLLVVGHTDDVWNALPATMAKHPSNWHLSAHRAISVETILANSGMAETRLAVMGMGEFRPLAPNAPGKKGNPQNRRVEIYIVPTGKIHLTIKSGLSTG
jgi:chemotaxis protein MotB